MTGRRPLAALLALPALALPALALPAPPAPIAFRVLRNGGRIGTHRVGFTAEGAALTALTEVAIEVRILGITAYRLAHRFSETWEGGRLRAATSRLERNGKTVELAVRAAAGELRGAGPGGPLRLPPEAAPLTWWNPTPFAEARPLFDNETGAPLDLGMAREALAAGGQRWQATRGEEQAGTYAADGRWTGWRLRAEDGSLITYEPLA